MKKLLQPLTFFAASTAGVRKNILNSLLLLLLLTVNFYLLTITSVHAQQLGTITPPSGVPTVTTAGGDPTNFVATLIKNGLTLLIAIAFIIALIWTIFGGIRFITSNGDEKTVSSAWSQIYWGLIGLIVVLASFAIINLVQTFFGIDVIGNFKIPTR